MWVSFQREEKKSKNKTRLPKFLTVSPPIHCTQEWKQVEENYRSYVSGGMQIFLGQGSMWIQICQSSGQFKSDKHCDMQEAVAFN